MLRQQVADNSGYNSTMDMQLLADYARLPLDCGLVVCWSCDDGDDSYC